MTRSRIGQKGANVDRREFVKYGAAGVAGLAVAATVPWLNPEDAMATNLRRENGKKWKFGVMADTQWIANLDGQNPGTVAIGIVNLLNAEFIKHDVKFVIQVGDLVDKEDNASNGFAGQRTMPIRATAAKALYDAGIGFYPLRGNHEGSATAANEFVALYPQVRGFGGNVRGADNFSSPFASLDGLSYSFDFDNTRFIMLDQFARRDGSLFDGTKTAYVNPASASPSTSAVANSIVDQLSWVDNRLSRRRAGTHAFVLSHKNLIGQNHVDCLFGDDPSKNVGARNTFISSLQKNGVRYTLGGHDHMHHRSIVTSPDGTANVKQLICSSDSYKFYYPANPANDTKYNSPNRERAASQELDTFGYYIVTVEGPKLTVDFYSSTIGLPFGTPVGNEDKLTATPTHIGFYHRERFGYSLNGKEFVVAQGGAYNVVKDTFEGTAAAILSGANGSTGTDAAGRKLVKTVNTGWSCPAKTDDRLVSNVLTLWGIADSLSLWDENLGETAGLLPNADHTKKGDTYTLALSYVRTNASQAARGAFGIATRNEKGKWVNAVDKNSGGVKKFVNGPWSSSYGLGTYGVDTRTNIAWAILDYEIGRAHV